MLYASKQFGLESSWCVILPLSLSNLYFQTVQCMLTYDWYWYLVYTTQVNSTFHTHWLASLEVISQVLFMSKQPKKNKVAFVSILSQIKLLFGPLVIQPVWYILKQLFTSVSVNNNIVLVYTTKAEWLAAQRVALSLTIYWQKPFCFSSAARRWIVLGLSPPS